MWTPCCTFWHLSWSDFFDTRGSMNQNVGDLTKHFINGHFRILNWRYLRYIRPICQAYVRGYTPKIWPEIWYSTSILGSWNSHWLYGDCMVTNWGKAWRCSRWKPNAWRLGDWFNHQRLIWACLGWTRNIWGLTIKSEDKRSCNVG